MLVVTAAAAAAFAIAALAPTRVAAFDGTAPLFVAQAPGVTNSGSSLQATSFVAEPDVAALLDGILTCPLVSLVVQQPKVHAHDVQRHADALPSFKAVFGPPSVKIPFVEGDMSLSRVLDSLSKCGELAVLPMSDGASSFLRRFVARELSSDAADASVKRDLPEDKNGLVYIATLPPFDGSVAKAAANDASLDKWVARLRSQTDDVQIIFASPLVKSRLSRRATSSSSNTTVPFAKQPILQKYIFFNSGLFEAIVALVLLISIVLFGVNALTSLQTPTKFEK
ncbi:hypothetical protein HK405_011191 [Cladochytrium tenue]|nr:hypothetical protein HK405_011191 [Cladochytrium tenue]